MTLCEELTVKHILKNDVEINCERKVRMKEVSINIKDHEKLEKLRMFLTKENLSITFEPITNEKANILILNDDTPIYSCITDEMVCIDFEGITTLNDE